MAHKHDEEDARRRDLTKGRRRRWRRRRREHLQKESDRNLSLDYCVRTAQQADSATRRTRGTLTAAERIAELCSRGHQWPGPPMVDDKQTIADLERQVATLQHQLRLENNRRRHLEVRAAQLQAAWWSARKELWGARSELYESEAINDQLRMAGDQRVADADLLNGFVVDELPR